MRISTFLAVLALMSCAHAQSVEVNSSAASEDFGFGPGIVMREITRDTEHSVFGVLRNYEYKDLPGVAWGTPHSFFVACALQKIGAARGATKVRFAFETMDKGQLRLIRDNESFASIGSDQLYLQVEWLKGDIGDLSAVEKERIIPFNDQLVQSCKGFRKKASLSE